MLINIDHPGDPRLADYRTLPATERGRRRGTFIAEGRLLVRTLLAADRFDTRSVLTTAAALEGLADRLAARPEVPVYVAAPGLVRDLVGYRFSRGCLAAASIRASAALVDLLGAGARRLVALERVTDPDNVGAVFRTCRALGAHGVLVSPDSCDPLYRKALRVSMGAALELPFAWVPSWPTALTDLRAAGFTIAALTPDGEMTLSQVGSGRVLERLVLVVGGERDGVGRETRSAADLRLRIAMAPGVDSLNLAAATAIALHHFCAPTT